MASIICLARSYGKTTAVSARAETPPRPPGLASVRRSRQGGCLNYNACWPSTRLRTMDSTTRQQVAIWGQAKHTIERGGKGWGDKGAESWPPPACCECTRGEHSSASRAYVAPESLGSRTPLKLRLARFAPKSAVVENKHSTETLYVLFLLRASSVSMSIYPDGKPRHSVLRSHSRNSSQ